MSRASLALLAAVALGLRLIAIGHESYWYDEAITVFNSSGPLADIPHQVAIRDVSPPLYFVVLGLWIKLFGAGEAAVRALSALGGVVALVAFHRAATRVAGREPANLAAALFCISPFAIRFAQEARMYGLLFPLAWIALAHLARLADDPAPRRFALLALLNVLVLYTHAFGALIPLLALVYLLVRAGRREALRFLAIQSLFGLAFIPWLVVMIHQVRERMGGFWIGKPDLASVHFLFYVMAGGSPTADGFPLVALASRCAVRLAYAAVAIGLYRSWRDRLARPQAWHAARVCVVGLALPIGLVFVFSHLVTPLFVDRYFLFLAPFFWLAVALAGAGLPGRRGWLVVLMALALHLPVLIHQYRDLSKEDWRGAVQSIESSGRPADAWVDTGGMMVLMAYRRDHARPPSISTVQGGFPQRHLTAPELVDALKNVESFWMLFTPYGPGPTVYRPTLKTTFDEDDYRELAGLSIGHYRRKR